MEQQGSLQEMENNDEENKHESDSDLDDRDALAVVHVTPGDFRGMPSWSVEYAKQLNREKIQANYVRPIMLHVSFV